MCDLVKSKVDDSEVYQAFINRNNPFVCGGRKWEINPDIVVTSSDLESYNLCSEDWIESFMPQARDIVSGKVSPPMFSCGGLETAIKRAILEKEFIKYND